MLRGALDYEEERTPSDDIVMHHMREMLDWFTDFADDLLKFEIQQQLAMRERPSLLAERTKEKKHVDREIAKAMRLERHRKAGTKRVNDMLPEEQRILDDFRSGWLRKRAESLGVKKLKHFRSTRSGQTGHISLFN